MEQHHAAVTFKILSKETSNIFANIKGEDYKLLRKLIIANILATDMKVHFEVMNQFNDVRDRIEKSGEENFGIFPFVLSSINFLVVWNDEDVKTVTGMIVHCADVCGPTKSFQIAYEWSLRVNKEFSIQVKRHFLSSINLYSLIGSGRRGSWHSSDSILQGLGQTLHYGQARNCIRF